jgi:hypothetical protein
MAESNTTRSGGCGISGLLFVAFVVLKLTHVIDWSWWWVTAPLWIPVLIVLGICAIVLLIALAVELCDRR